MQLAHLNWRRAEEKLSDPNTVVVIPVGSTEQHGPIGPLGTDWMIPQWICSQMSCHTCHSFRRGNAPHVLCRHNRHGS